MKKLMMIVAAALVMVGCNNPKTYVVEGHIDGEVKEVAVMNMAGDEVYATATAENGSFVLQVESKVPMFATLAVDGASVLPLFLDGSPIKVEGNVQSPDSISVTGTASNEAFMTFARKQNELFQPIIDGSVSDEEMPMLFVKMEELVNESYEENKDNLWGAYIFMQSKYRELSAEEILETVAGYPKDVQKMDEIVTLKEYAENMLKTEIGKPYTNIVLPNVNGEEVSLQSVVEANKYVLIDFWASWCRPCMGEMPYLLDAYAQFHDKGFEIYGVSLDENAEAWKGTIEKQGMKWVNVSEVTGWQTQAVQDYSVNSIPANFLIDGEGKIVAKNLRGEALVETLTELFQ
ncbi:MAG: AhpC/TSA family protein [Tidjanibacter sp.]|nr:AhpC/TSA family protein [Tidjanibacter sp.]